MDSGKDDGNMSGNDVEDGKGGEDEAQALFMVDNSPEWTALTNPVILSHTLQYVKEEAKNFRLVHPLWNEAVLSHVPLPRLNLSFSLGSSFLTQLPGLLKIIGIADARIGRAISVKEDFVCSNGHGDGPTALTALVAQGLEETVQDLELSFKSHFTCLFLLVRLLEQYPFPKLRSLKVIQHFVCRCKHTHTRDEEDRRDAANLHSSNLLHPYLSSIRLAVIWSKCTDKAKSVSQLNEFVQRLMNSAPNLLKLTLIGNLSPSFEANLKLSRLEVHVDFSILGDHDNDDGYEHYTSAACYPDILTKLGVLSGCLESLIFRCLNVGTSCTTCTSMIKHIPFPVMEKLKTLELYTPSCFLSNDVNQLETLSKCLPRLQILTLTGRTPRHLKDLQPIIKNGIKSLLRSRSLPSSRGPMDLRILSTEPQTLLNPSLIQSLKSFKTAVLHPPAGTNKLAIKFIEFEQENGALITDVLDSLACLPLEQLSIGLRVRVGDFDLTTLIKSFYKSRIFDSGSLQVLNIMVAEDMDIDFRINRENLRMFEDVLGRVKHMRNVTFVNFSMPVSEAVLLGRKIEQDNLPVRFLPTCDAYLSQEFFP